MKSRSAKAKGRRLQNTIAEMLQAEFGLSEADVRPAVGSENGMDIKLSSVAREKFPFALEAKNQERLNIWQALEQAEKNAGGLTPAVVFKRNRSEIYIGLSFDSFCKIIAENQRLHRHHSRRRIGTR